MSGWTPPPALPPVEQWRTDDGIRCLECGQWKRALGSHLRNAHGLSADEYRRAWGMRQRQPLTCGDVSAVRRRIAIESGGPERLSAFLPQVSEQAHEAARKREHRAQEQAVVIPRMVSTRTGRQAGRRQELRDRAVEGTGLSFEAWAQREYVGCGRTIRDLAGQIGASETMMKSLLLDAGVRLRPRGPSPQGR